MKPVLYESSETNFSTLGIGVLSDAISCYVKTVLNGLFELEMQYPITGMWYKEIKISRIIKATAEKGGSAQLFDIYAITKPINGVVTVNASHVSGRKQFIPIMPCSASNIIEAFDEIEEHAAENNPFTLWTSKDTVANFNLKTPASLGQVLGGMEGSILDTYRGEYEFDNFTIRFMTRRGQDNGVSLRYGKNITDIEQEESIASTITGICPFWADESGNSITLPEMTVDSPNAANFPFKRTITLDLSTVFQERPTEAQIRAYAQAYVSNNQIGVPKVGISVSFENLADYEEFKDVALLEQVRLGDTVHVYFEPLDITAEARVTETNYDVLNDKYKKIRVGSVKSTLSQTINNIENETAAMIESRTSGLEQAFERALEAFSGIDGGNIIIRYNEVTGKPYEILAMDTDDINTAVNVTRLNYQGIGISSNGINGPYTMALVAGQGLVATAIYAGILEGITVKGTEIIGSEFTAGRIITLHASDYTQADVDRIGQIILGYVTPTQEDYEHLDVNKDGEFNSLDMAYIQSMLTYGNDLTIDARVFIDGDANTNEIIKVGSSKIGYREIYAPTVMGEQAEFTNSIKGGGLVLGATGYFSAGSSLLWFNPNDTNASISLWVNNKGLGVSSGLLRLYGEYIYYNEDANSATFNVKFKQYYGFNVKNLSDKTVFSAWVNGSDEGVLDIHDSTGQVRAELFTERLTFRDASGNILHTHYANPSNNAKLLGDTTSSSWTYVTTSYLGLYRAFVLVACRGAVDGGRGAMASTYIPYELARLCTSTAYESWVQSAQNSVYAGRCYFDFTNNRIYLISSGNADCRIKIYGIT